MMTSLLVDGRPIHGDPGLPAVTRVFGDLRRHPGTMRLLLQESLSKRAKLRPMRHLLSRQPETFDINHTDAVYVIDTTGASGRLDVHTDGAAPVTEVQVWCVVRESASDTSSFAYSGRYLPIGGDALTGTFSPACALLP